MQCPACKRTVPMSFRCKACGAPLTGSAPPLPPAARPSPVPPPVEDTRAAQARPVARARATPRLDRIRGDVFPASPGARLWAAVLDAWLAAVCLGPGYGLLLLARTQSGLHARALVYGALAFIAASALALLTYQALLLARQGQTWGKVQAGVRIVRYPNAEPVGLGRSLGLRLLLNGILVTQTSCFGWYYGLADAMFILGPEGRCIHDRLAGTMVVAAD
jgi:uncharacterized RDD family membrane protein YckC